MGIQGLQKTHGVATFLIATEGTAVVTLLNEQADPYLPQFWRNKRLSTMTRDDAPLIGQIQCIDVILRPGSCLVLPPHWRYCVEEKAEDIRPVCLLKVVVQHPISRFVERVERKRS